LLNAGILRGEDENARTASILRSLLDAGADIHAPTDRYGLTPLAWAAHLGLAEESRLMLSYSPTGHQLTELHAMAAKGKVRATTVLLDVGLQVNAVHPRWQSRPLHLAALHGHADVVHLLLQRGADAHAGDARGRSAFDLALAGGHSDLAANLLRAMDAGANAIGATMLDALRECDGGERDARECNFYAGLGTITAFPALLRDERPVALPLPPPVSVHPHAHVQLTPADAETPLEVTRHAEVVLSHGQGPSVVIIESVIHHGDERGWSLHFPIAVTASPINALAVRSGAATPIEVNLRWSGLTPSGPPPP